MFCWLGLQGQPDGSSLRNIFEDSCTEDGTIVGKSIFEGGFKFSASDARKNFNRTASAVQREEDRYAYPSTQEHKNLEDKLKHRVKRSIILPGSDQGVIEEQIWGSNTRSEYQGANIE